MASSLRPVFTTFDRSAIPTNLLTVAEWATFASAVVGRYDWMAGVRRYTAQAGGALVMKADDSLVCFTMRNGQLCRRTHKPRTWGWAA